MDLIIKAINFSAKAHEKQYRKGTNIPYISHPYTVGMLLRESNCTEIVVTAGILHDVVEDTHYTLHDIEVEFGKNVAEIVEGCSEPDKALPWEERKEQTIAFLREAREDIKLVACADKLHNLMSTYDNLLRDGDQVWNRFKRGKESQEWYYRNVFRSINYGLEKEYRLVKQLKSYIQNVFG